ncbi:MAG: ABC transporter permease [Clostridia bacterium]|nr:ABC transporter permease [Clostridia bacterium]
MRKYLLKRILFSIFSLIVVVALVMILVYTCIHRNVIFQTDDVWNKKSLNDQKMYEYIMYQKYGYLNYDDYGSFLKEKYMAIYGDDYATQPDFIADRDAIQKPELAETNASVQEFKEKYKNREIIYLEPVLNNRTHKVKSGGKAYLFAVHEKSVFVRLWDYFTHIITFESTKDVEDEALTERYVRFEKDPYSGAFALVGSGTQHKYLLYFNERFPFIHQNWMHFNLGTSYTTYRGQEITTVITTPTGELKNSMQQYPKALGTDEYVESAVDFHSLTYNPADLTPAEQEEFNDKYTVYSFNRSGLSRLENSFVIGLISVFLAYGLGVSIGIAMSRRKDGLLDKIGNAYIVFVAAVPSLAYIFLVAAIGQKVFHLPYKFAVADPLILGYIMPTISLSLGSIGSLMKWTRRYMIDQMNSDYVKFARAEGMSEKEIYNLHISRNATIYLVQGIPSSILFCLTGALMTERVYGVPGVGGLLINAINAHDNAVIVAMVLIITSISILGLILGDLLLAAYDPRISLSTDSGGGRK